MGEGESAGTAAVTQSQDPEQIEREIEQTRRQLGDTVAALARKTDVKAQARQRLEHTKAAVAENPVPLAVAGAVAAGFLAWRVFGR